MNVGWLIDASVFAEEHDELAAAVARQGLRIRSLNRPRAPYGWDDTDGAYREAFPAGSCVVTRADIDLVLRILADGLWMPGAFATVERFSCSSYFPHFGRFLLNQDHAMLPFGELARRREFLFDTFGREGQIFIRPDSTLKLFTGQIACRDTYERDLEFMAFYEFPVESLVVVSSPKSIAAEWRFVVARGEVIAGSQYRRGPETFLSPDIPLEARRLAEQVAAVGYAPDPVWTMDICQTEYGICHLLEIGCFSFANLYACDRDAVVEAVSKVAWEIHQDTTSEPR